MLLHANFVERDVRQLCDAIAGERRRAFSDRIGERLGGGSAITRVVLDAEIAVGATGVVAGRKNDSACAALTNQV